MPAVLKPAIPMICFKFKNVNVLDGLNLTVLLSVCSIAVRCASAIYLTFDVHNYCLARLS